jgi:hypothetical protein
MVQGLINSDEIKKKYRRDGKCFMRMRKLSFGLLIIMILRKSMKSLQLMLNEVTGELGVESISNSAFSQRRAQLKHGAFIELNQKAIVKTMYGDGDYKRYKGLRLLAIDGSKVRLPETEEIRREFGAIEYRNGEENVRGKHNYGLASVMYDVLNKIAIDSHLGKSRDYEVDLALKHLEHTDENDVLICDRNYPSYCWLGTLEKMGRKYIVRCSESSYKQARAMLKGEGADSQLTTIKPSYEKAIEINRLKLPRRLTVRFVRVLLKTGKYEVLVTNLLDEQLYPTEDFKELYHLRWRCETFYGILKTRLNLEHFSGKTVESVYQDFYATVFLTGLESILIEDSNIALLERETIYPQQVNHAVSFNAIKNHAVELFYSEKSSDKLMNKLEKLFLTNPTRNRFNKPPPPRKNSSSKNLLNYFKRLCKISF